MEHQAENQEPFSHPIHSESTLPAPSQGVQAPDPTARMAMTGFVFGLASAFAWGVYFLPPSFPHYYTPIANIFPYIYFGTTSGLIALALIFSFLGLKSSTWKRFAVTGLVLALIAFQLFAFIGCLFFFKVEV